MTDMTLRLPALRRFAAAITILNLLGRGLLGFEPSWATIGIALLSTYSTEAALELISAVGEQRRPRFLGGFVAGIDFFLSSHITGMAISMLLFAHRNPWPIVFACVAAVCSKALLRAPLVTGAWSGSVHFLNPSNIGITLTLVLFPWVSIAPPYQFTENTTGAGDILLPLLIIASGTFLNWRFTGRIPLILSWFAGFVGQAIVRCTWNHAPLTSGLMPMTGVAFVLFSYYMVSDPATTPGSRQGQICFGLGVAGVYGVLMALHVVFGLFFALTIVCVLRGIGMMLSRSLGRSPQQFALCGPARL